MLAYQNLIREIKQYGVRTPNRTGIDTIKLDGAMMRFNLLEGFPATTSKKLAFKSVIGEFCAFMRASRSAADFRALGCKVWDANANHHNADGSPNAWLANPFRQGEDDLGPIYGVQWREWPGYKLINFSETAQIEKAKQDGWVELMTDTIPGHRNLHMLLCKEIDQLGDCLRKIIKTPNDRRILFHGWNPAVLDEVALPACHLLYHFLPDSVNKRLNMIVYIRSNDVGLGTPFNIAESAVMVETMARLAGYKPGRLTYFTGDAHIYVNQLDYLDELLTKEPLPLPTLKISDRVPSYNPADNAGFMDESGDTQIEHLVEWLRLIEPSDYTLENYQHHTLLTPVPKMVV